MTPFGAVNYNSNPSLDEFLQSQNTENQSTHSVTFSPDRQVLHDRTNWDVRISSADEISENKILKIYYNSIDVTDSFLKTAEISQLAQSKQLNIEFKDLKLPASKTNKIALAFQPQPGSPLLLAKYLPPTCSQAESLELTNTGKFSATTELIQWIRNTSAVNNYNPSLLAGLIAQESAFNPNQISRSKAMGLTQITPVADREIQSITPNWPRSEKITEYGSWRLKMLINKGNLSGRDDWRLDSKLSIEGGMIYLKFLTDYWSRPENLALINNNYSNPSVGFTAVVLASYNSGPARVKKSLIERGTHWLEAENLTEAKKYVNRVMSYCYHFGKREAI